MMRQFKLLFALAGFVFSALMLSAQDSNQTLSPAVTQAVGAAFAQSLRLAGDQQSGEDSTSENISTCATTFSENPDGTPNLIAAASGGNHEAVGMLAYKPDNTQILDGVNDSQLAFDVGECDASIVNLADPAQPSSLLAKSVEISFRGQDWYFRWNGKKLQNITALYPDDRAKYGIPPDSYMHTTDIVDIDHSGAMQIVGNNGDSDKFQEDDGIASSGTKILFRYNGTAYAPVKTLLFASEYTPQPSNWSEEMSGSWANAKIQIVAMHQTPVPSYRLRIVNGDRDGSNRATNAVVEINGVAVVLPYEVNQGVEALTRTIQLQKENTIKVSVEGPVKSHIYVTVE